MNKPKAFICGGGVMLVSPGSHGKPPNLPAAIQSQDQECTDLLTWSRTTTGGFVRMVVGAAPPVIALSAQNDVLLLRADGQRHHKHESSDDVVPTRNDG